MHGIGFHACILLTCTCAGSKRGREKEPVAGTSKAARTTRVTSAGASNKPKPQDGKDGESFTYTWIGVGMSAASGFILQHCIRVSANVYYLNTMCARTGKGKVLPRLKSRPVRPSTAIPEGMSLEEHTAWVAKYNAAVIQFFRDNARYDDEVRARVQCSFTAYLYVICIFTACDCRSCMCLPAMYVSDCRLCL